MLADVILKAKRLFLSFTERNILHVLGSPEFGHL